MVMQIVFIHGKTPTGKNTQKNETFPWNKNLTLNFNILHIIHWNMGSSIGFIYQFILTLYIHCFTCEGINLIFTNQQYTFSLFLYIAFQHVCRMSNVGQVGNICILSWKIGSNVIAYFELIRKQLWATTSYIS